MWQIFKYFKMVAKIKTAMMREQGSYIPIMSTASSIQCVYPAFFSHVTLTQTK